MTDADGRYVMLISVHGLIRGSDMELGRDADTGGQTKYVVELARALVEHPDVSRVDLVTRLIADPKIDPVYAQPFEELAQGARIVRIRCGPDRYLAKESLWPHLESFADNLVNHLRSEGQAPDLVHGHYADAGYVASCLSGLLDLPMAFTGHSLGRVKRQRLLDQGTKLESIERRYRISRRIEAEETALDNAAFVVASTHQEVDEQYAVYDNYQPRRMMVIPPGVDLSRFTPPSRSSRQRPPIFAQIARFLTDPGKPMILALSRPDVRKNIATLIRAYGENHRLREAANLVIVAGTRDDIRALDKGAREVLNELLYLIDRYDLYGQVAYPKRHHPDDVPDFYRLAAATKGVLVNPALTEPFGLTLLEAAASGLPVVATQDGGPREIISHCNNGLLVDPLDAEAMSAALLGAVSDQQQWRKWSRSGLRGAQKHFTWASHVKKYMRSVKTAVGHSQKRPIFYSSKSRLITADRILLTDVDNTLVGDGKAIEELLRLLHDTGRRVAVGIATGRNLELTLQILKEWNVPTPQLLITSVGSAVLYGPHLVEDRGWVRHINYRWRPEAIREAMAWLPGLKLQSADQQSEHKISYDVDPEQAPSTKDIARHLRRARLQVKVIYSHRAYLDLLPIRASKGMALRYFAGRWGIPLECCLVAGDSGNDEDMLTGNTLGVVVGNYDPDLEHLRGEPRIYFAKGHHSWGIIEGIEHYNFFGQIRIPEQKAPEHEAVPC